jgi:aminoacyl tRNA synthase complex-interacting multifunctional protein 1
MKTDAILLQAKASHSDLLSHAAVTRHFDHVQNLPLVSTALARSSIFTPATVSINVSEVPSVEIKPDVKVKKPKAEGAPAAEQPKKVVNKDAVVADKKKGEQRVENAEQIKEKGEKKPKGEKKEKVKGEKKPAPPAPVVEAPAPWMVDLRVGKIIDGTSPHLASRSGSD